MEVRPPKPVREEKDTTGIESFSTKVTNITGLSGVTYSGRIFAAPVLPTRPINAKGKAKKNEGPASSVTPASEEDVPAGRFTEKKEESGRKEVSTEEASEFLRMI